jgi:hypothetical protein
MKKTFYFLFAGLTAISIILYFAANHLVSTFKARTGIELDWRQITLSIDPVNLHFGGINLTWSVNENLQIGLEDLQMGINPDALTFSNGRINVYLFDPTHSRTTNPQKLLEILNQLPVRSIALAFKNVEVKVFNNGVTWLESKFQNADISYAMHLFKIHFDLDSRLQKPFSDRSDVYYSVRGSAFGSFDRDHCELVLRQIEISEKLRRFQLSGSANLEINAKSMNYGAEGQIQEVNIKDLLTILSHDTIEQLPIELNEGLIDPTTFNINGTVNGDGQVVTNKIDLKGGIRQLKGPTLISSQGFSSQFSFQLEGDQRETRSILELQKMAIDLPYLSLTDASALFQLNPSSVALHQFKGTLNHQNIQAFGKISGLKSSKTLLHLKLSGGPNLIQLESKLNKNLELEKVKIAGHLRNMNFNAPNSLTRSDSKNTQAIDLTQTRIHLDLKGQDISINDIKMNLFDIKAQSKKQELIFNRLELRMEDFNLITTNASWKPLSNVTHAAGYLNIGPSSAILKNMNIQGSSIRTLFDLKWQGGPWTWSLEKSQGSGVVEATKGDYIGINRYWKAALNMMSLDTKSLLENRLLFNNIYTQFKIVDQRISFENANIDLPAARLKGELAVKLANHNLEGQVSVLPKYSKSLIGTVATYVSPFFVAPMTLLERRERLSGKNTFGLNFKIGHTLKEPIISH